MYVESCTILVVVNRLSRPVVVLDGLPGLYGFKYDSATACGLPLYLYSYKLVGSATSMGEGRKESHRGGNLGGRRKRKEGTREGSSSECKESRERFQALQQKRMTRAGGTPPPTPPLYRPRAGGSALDVKWSPPDSSPGAQR